MTVETEAIEGLVRIRVPLERSPGEEGPPDDWVWGEPLGNGRYRIESCPFFAYGISRDDVVRADPAEGDPSPGATPLLDGVVEKCGHRTLRVALDAAAELTDPPVRELLDRLVELGCTHELHRPKIVAIDLPPEVDLEAIAALLEGHARAGRLLWEWADPRPC